MLTNIDDVFKKIVKKETLTERVRCQNCGKFISQKSIETYKAKFHFIPDNEFGPEEAYWECEKCS